jgi:hypothetical protein
MKKFFYGAIALLSVSIIFLSCSPDAGEPGGAGTNGKNVGLISGSTAVTADELKALFVAADIVTLGPEVPGVAGVVPLGKTLAVSGETAVTDGKVLEVEADGSVVVYEGAILTATGVSTAAGLIYGTGSAVSGAGIVVLPYKAETPAEDDPLLYNTSSAKNKAAGSAGGSALTAAAVAEILEKAGTLTAYNLEGIKAATVPEETTLSLLGSGNKTDTTDGLDLSATTAGSLVVLAGSTLAATPLIKANATTSNITNNGTITLPAAVTAVSGLTNNGTVISATTSEAIQKTLVTLAGTGTVELSGAGANALDSAVTLTQNVVINGAISSAAKLIAPLVAEPFDGGKTITVGPYGELALSAAVAGVGFSKVTIVNKGTVSTATVSVPALNAIAALGGKVSSTGVVAGNEALTVPKGTTLTHTTGTFVGGSGAIIIAGDATFTTGTFASQTGAVTVSGKAVFTSGTFAGLTAPVVVSGDATFTAGTFAGLVGTASTPIFTVEKGGKAALTAATFALTTVGTIVVNGTATLGAAAVPGGDVTVGGTLTIAGGLQIADGQSLDLSGGGKVVLKGDNTAEGKLALGTVPSTANGKQTVIAAAQATAVDNLTTDAVLTANGAVATITVAPPKTTGGTEANGTSTAGVTTDSSEANAAITTGKAKAETVTTSTTKEFASATAVVADTTAVVPDAKGFGKGVTIQNGVISVDKTNSAYGATGGV